MARAVKNLADESRWLRRRGQLAVRVWRYVGTVPQVLFTFTGTVDAIVLSAVLQHVCRLTCELPGLWRIEVSAAGLERRMLQAVAGALRELRLNGQQTRFVLTRRVRPAAAAWSARKALALLAPTLPH